MNYEPTKQLLLDVSKSHICEFCLFGHTETERTTQCRLDPEAVPHKPDYWCGQGVWLMARHADGDPLPDLEYASLSTRRAPPLCGADFTQVVFNPRKPGESITLEPLKKESLQ